MAKGWKKITEEMACNYGCTSKKGDLLLTISALCEDADNEGAVRYEQGGLIGQIPTCSKAGSDFAGENMIQRLLGLACLFPALCHPLITHDLNSFSIPKIGELVTEIRMM